MRASVHAESILLSVLSCVIANAASAGAAERQVEVDPPSVRLSGPTSAFSLLVTGKTAEGRLFDLTGKTRFRSADPAIATVDAAGVVRPVANGAAEVVVEVDGVTRTVAVLVEDAQSDRRPTFLQEVLPVITRFGCNGGACHGKAEGQAGFKLSIFGSDPESDYRSVRMGSRGRRVLPGASDSSLLLEKAIGAKPHGGGVRFKRDSRAFRAITDWISTGMAYGDETISDVVRVEVAPRQRIMGMGARQRLRVVAHFRNGQERDVTPLAQFESNDEELAAVSTGGLVTAGERPGQVAIVVSYLNHFAVYSAAIPRPEPIAQGPDLPEANFIDRLVFGKLRDLNIAPSGLSDDAEFLRRVHLDIIGTLPTADETRRFLGDRNPERRSRLVDELLQRPEYADYWAMKFADVLRVERRDGALDHKGAYAYHAWIRDSFAANKPFDRFIRELLVAQGPLSEAPAGHFYKVVTSPGAVASELSQSLMGVRLACAQCHHHPTDVWTQADYYGMQSFFAQVSLVGSPRGQALRATGQPVTKHPRTGAVVQPYPLGARMPEVAPEGDRRAHFAKWLTSPDNGWFAKHLANRLWAHFLGRGIVEPVDDARATNPPANPELLDALARHVVEAKFDLHETIRTITASSVYRLSSLPNDTNAKDRQNHSRAFLRPLEAEVLLDAVCQATGVKEKFEGVPAGYRAIQLWDSSIDHFFLKLFGRPLRKSACLCERNDDASVAQALHLMNSPEIHAKLSHDAGTVVRFVGQFPENGPLVEELYVNFFSRFPSAEEREKGIAYLKNASDRRRGAEDLAWSMLCSIEFLFRH